MSKVSKLARFAKTQPHAAHATFTHGLSSEWTYLSRSVHSLEEYLQPLEDVIRCDLLPYLTGRAVSDLERRPLSLPARLKGMAMCNPVHEAWPHFDQASAVIAPMVHHICSAHEDSGDFVEALGLQCEGLVGGRKRREAAFQEKANDIYSQLDPHSQRAMSLAQEKGASIWLTTVPMDEHAFVFSWGDFRDAICLRYTVDPICFTQNFV